MLTFDVSGSMAATDLQPTRMEAAERSRRRSSSASRRASSIGVVAFSDAGIAVQAPTSDQAAVLAAIDRLVPARGHVARAGHPVGARRDREGARRTRRPTTTATARRGARGDACRRSSRRATRRRSSSCSATARTTSGRTRSRWPQEAADRGIRIVDDRGRDAAGADLDLDGFKVQTQLDEATLHPDRRHDRRARTTRPTTRTASRRLPGPPAEAGRARRAARGHGAVRGARARAALVGGALSLAWSGRLP